MEECQYIVAQDSPKLSICIATYKRGAYIAETIEAILHELPESVEVIIVDGASPDNTREAIEPFVRRSSVLRYIRETTNSGVDQDFDKAVGYARGEYCWLLSDDDILVPGGSAEPDVLLKNFLGRGVSLEPFYRDLGIQAPVAPKPSS